ncbi:hypothetical protein K435DRAFT_765577 [Dendrothele bispora CBS 962.96]|uniref:NACHT domain-containing protein n=1 Tax=Dendrothele bispora (strain CBS 962.96) TaxID=1314807 RepID=A0A4S8L5Y2_DENBC|nr:hypothetical protein K435DRAFT_765577 [Dendrothele bispora CBS 962.96]
MTLPRQTLDSQNVQVLPPSNPRRRPRDSPEQDDSSSERRTRPRLEVDNFEEQRDVPKSLTLDSTSRVTSFARSQHKNDPNSRFLPPLIPRRRPLDSLEQDGSNSERRTKPRLEVNNFEEQHDVPKSPTLDSTSRVASFARSHHNMFHNSTINTIGRDQINFTDLEGAGLDLLYQGIAQVGAFYDSEDRFPPPRCHPQTREAVLADISAWITGQNTSLRNSNQGSARSSQRLVHWLYGPAGVGKSAIAQTLAESFEGSHLAASFFFSRSSSKRDNSRTLFTTVAYCLAVSGDTELRAAIDKTVRKRQAILGASIESQFLELVVKPLENLPRERWGNLPKVVIIDGLDECQGSDSQRRVLTTFLNQLVDEKGEPRYRIPLRFLIASRPEPQIRDIFNKPEYLDITTRTELGDNYSTSRDIERYLRDSFHKIARTSDVMRSVPLPWPSQGVIDNLVQRASGQFIYVSTLIKYVSDEYSHPVERLELALGLPIGDPDAFSDLNLLYRQIMSSSRNRPRVLQILGAFYCLQEMPETSMAYPGFHPRESIGLMENILLLSPGAISLALRNLHSVLEINQDSFHFRHKSFTDFLFDERRSGEFFLDLPLYHELITRCCMKIANEAQTDIPQLTRSPQLRYAQDQFIFHLEHSKITAPLIDDLKNFNFLYCFRPGMWDLERLNLSRVLYDTGGKSDPGGHLYLRQVIINCNKYLEILTEKFRDSLQQPTSNLKHGLYVSGIRRNYLHFISEVEILFAFLLPPDPGTYPDTGFSTLTELVYNLRLDNMSDSLAEISICHPYFYPPAFNPDCGGWYFIDFSRGHSSLAKCHLQKIRLNPRFRADRSWTHNFRRSAHELSLVEELVETIEFLREPELLEAINWLQRYPDKCHIVKNAIDKCTERTTILRYYQPTV